MRISIFSHAVLVVISQKNITFRVFIFIKFSIITIFCGENLPKIVKSTNTKTLSFSELNIVINRELSSNRLKREKRIVSFNVLFF